MPVDLRGFNQALSGWSGTMDRQDNARALLERQKLDDEFRNTQALNTANYRKDTLGQGQQRLDAAAAQARLAREAEVNLATQGTQGRTVTTPGQTALQQFGGQDALTTASADAINTRLAKLDEQQLNKSVWSDADEQKRLATIKTVQELGPRAAMYSNPQNQGQTMANQTAETDKANLANAQKNLLEMSQRKSAIGRNQGMVDANIESQIQAINTPAALRAEQQGILAKSGLEDIEATTKTIGGQSDIAVLRGQLAQTKDPVSRAAIASAINKKEATNASLLAAQQKAYLDAMKPSSSVGKVDADLSKGLIDKKTRDAAVKKLTSHRGSKSSTAGSGAAAFSKEVTDVDLDAIGTGDTEKYRTAATRLQNTIRVDGKKLKSADVNNILQQSLAGNNWTLGADKYLDEGRLARNLLNAGVATSMAEAEKIAKSAMLQKD